jgi:hypothetical protein
MNIVDEIINRQRLYGGNPISRDYLFGCLAASEELDDIVKDVEIGLSTNAWINE